VRACDNSPFLCTIPVFAVGWTTVTKVERERKSKQMSESKKITKIITRPTLLVDKSKCLRNLQKMKSKVDQVNNHRHRRHRLNVNDGSSSLATSLLRFRPHCKTHASLEIGRWMKDEIGVDCITVSSLTMAQYFKEIFNDITVAFTVNILEIDTINDLITTSSSTTSTHDNMDTRSPLPSPPFKLNLLVENVETVQFLQQHLKGSVGIYIKIDVGYGRTGIRAQDFDRVAEVVRAILDDNTSDSSNTSNNNNNLVWKGLLTHAGQSYNCQTKQEILHVHRHAKKRMVDLRTELQSRFLQHTDHIEISIGDTPTCSVVEDPVTDWDQIDEIRPGNFVFYDVEQAQRIGCCELDDVAVAVACPIVAKHPDRNELILYGGGVHLSKDRCTVKMESGSEDEKKTTTTEKTIYGRVARSQQQTSPSSSSSSLLQWGDVIDGMYLRSTSQEHGIVVVPSTENFDSYNVGDILKVLPVHSCMTADVMSHRGYLTTDGEEISRMKD
jgi:D-serine deaminase-like pyridoxal phosphate-dependent protein